MLLSFPRSGQRLTPTQPWLISISQGCVYVNQQTAGSLRITPPDWATRGDTNKEVERDEVIFSRCSIYNMFLQTLRCSGVMLSVYPVSYGNLEVDLTGVFWSLWDNQSRFWGYVTLRVWIQGRLFLYFPKYGWKLKEFSHFSTLSCISRTLRVLNSTKRVFFPRRITPVTAWWSVGSKSLPSPLTALEIWLQVSRNMKKILAVKHKTHIFQFHSSKRSEKQWNG